MCSNRAPATASDHAVYHGRDLADAAGEDQESGTRGQGSGEQEQGRVNHDVWYPVADERLINAAIERDMQMVMDLILAIRNIRGEMNIAPSLQINVIVKVETRELASTLRKAPGMRDLARIKDLRIGVSEAKPGSVATAVITGAEVYVPLEGIIDLTQERDRLQKEIAKMSKDIEVFSKKLSNKNFVIRRRRKLSKRTRRSLRSSG